MLAEGFGCERFFHNTRKSPQNQPACDRQRKALILDNLVSIAGELLQVIRRDRPKVHCITNTVAETFTANVLLALGAVPSMTAHPAEVGAFVTSAHGVLINLGTPDEQRNAANAVAIEIARSEGLPWVLDPVFVDRSPLRLERTRELLASLPAVVRGNEGELNALKHDTADGFADLCSDYKTVAISTGQTDRIESVGRAGLVKNGHPVMAQVTAMGCAMSAVVAAFCAVHDDMYEASVSGLLTIGVCGELAAADEAGPGSFVPAFLDRLASIEEAELGAAARYSELVMA